MKKIRLGIVGASGLVGETILKVLKEENLTSQLELYLITSDRSAGKVVVFNGKPYTYFTLNDNIYKLNLDVVIFSSGDEVSKIWAKNLAEKGIYVIDNSNAFRRDKDIPLVVPEINSELINKNTKIISNPNCSTIQLAVVLHMLRKVASIEEVIVSSYQSVSGAGKDALDDLEEGTHKIFNCDIKNNIVAQIGDIEENGFCKEENKIMFETNKILSEQIKVLATAVRVPVDYCHGESVYVKFSQNIDEVDIKNALKCNFIENFDKIYHNYECFNSNKTYVFRFRKVNENEIMFFIMADNLRRGAAYNAVLILKKLIDKKFI